MSGRSSIACRYVIPPPIVPICYDCDSYYCVLIGTFLYRAHLHLYCLICIYVAYWLRGYFDFLLVAVFLHKFSLCDFYFLQGGYVLYRLFKKPEEKVSNPKADEVERSGLSPSPTRSSPDGTVHEGDVMEESSTPLNQKSPESGLQEKSQFLPGLVEQQPTVVKIWLTD